MSWMIWVSMVGALAAEPGPAPLPREQGPPADAVADGTEEEPAVVEPAAVEPAAEEPTAEAPAAVDPAAEDPVVRSRFKLPVQLHGFAETIARGDLTAKTFDFSLQQAELDVLGDWNDVVFLRTDLQYDAYYFDATSPVGFLGSFVEQATVDVQVHKGSALKIGLGRFNAPMGFEALDPADRPIASYSQVFNWLDPFLLTGARVSGAYKAFDFVVWVSQGYEVIADNNTDKTVGGRVAVRPGTAAYLGLAASYGSEYADNANRRQNLSLDYTITPTPKLLIGGEVTFRNEQGASKVRTDADGRALGAILEGSYRFHSMFSLAARVDTIQDFDGIIWGSKIGTTTWTVAPTLHLFDHARIQLEYKGYSATQPLFTTVSATPSAPNTSPTASQQFQGMNLAVDPTTAANLSHALTLQAIANF